MKIGIFSRFVAHGGSEFRCAELANGIACYTDHESFLLSEGDIPKEVLDKVDKRVSIRTNVLKEPNNVNVLYEMDNIVIVNSDSKLFTEKTYWQGKTHRHNSVVKLSKIKAFIFLFNFIVSPSIKLTSLLNDVKTMKIITTNSRFFNEISTQDRYKNVIHLPRMILESPVDLDSISIVKKASDKIRIGQHSVSMEQKFNEEIIELLAKINNKYNDRISWDFMGIPQSRGSRITSLPNVTVRKAFSIPVRDFLEGIDIFLFYPSWRRQEPWSRSVAEALASGCPVLATNKGGNCDQIIHGNNGYLCKDINAFIKHLSYLIENPRTIRILGDNSILYSRFFGTQYVVRKLMEFLT